MRLRIYIIVFLIAPSLIAQAAVVTAASVSLADVGLVASNAADGDTIIVPTGTASWGFTLHLTNGITLQGAGNDQTIITDNVDCAYSYGGILSATLNSNQTFRMTGFTFANLTNDGCAGAGGGTIFVGGACTNFRIYNCHFLTTKRVSIQLNGEILGVIDHNVFDSYQTEDVRVFHDGWAGNANGDGSWADDSRMGTSAAIFLEDNYFNCLKGYPGVIDMYDGARVVVRHNAFTNCVPTTHGTESSGRARSVRTLELYANTLVDQLGSFVSSMGQFRGGTGVVYSNVYTGTFGSASGMALTCYREFDSFSYWGQADGFNGWDTNTAGAPFAVGTHTSTNLANVLVDTNASWTANQWVGYTIVDTNTGRGTYITASGTNTITFQQDATYHTNMVFNYGDSYKVGQVVAALDQPGRGKGDLLANSSNPYNTILGGTNWPSQQLEPVYAWGNSKNGGGYALTSGYPTIQLNRDYYNDTVKPGYFSYVYPHPLVSGITPNSLPTLNVSGSARVGTLRTAQ